MKRLVLDSGLLIGLLSKKDKYHQEAKQGFSQIPDAFGEVLTPLPCLLYTSPSPRDKRQSRMPSSA